MENHTNYLVEKTDCILYYAEPSLSNEQGTGWIGGNAPDFFDDQADLIHEGNQKYYFYMCLVHPFKPESMISIFIPEDYEEYLDNNVYPKCSIKVVEHPISKESVKETFTNPGLLKHAISAGDISNDEKSMDQSFLIKLGGNPRLIQNNDYYFTKLKEESYSFLFQVDEDGYPDMLLRDDYSYPFGFGSLYIFAKIGAEGIQHPIAGFWQFS
ncbi:MULTISPECIES: hypothetical protein [Paenibacillus]|jgi:hypothetical protein|uniref:DUF1963 domain-containing protein n=2 Tax=Paenibacillus lactis TaxID=228574 RepID=G4HDA4_9BACL|nr:hypothetical protein [Paenibacillus lactis]EHB66030.1 hypothetical protein PaelaDRAFT_1957 [Paenibacillus lactis 154]MBP1891417.1 hypothetical protein [Paenibacillus lactis]MCM3493842.1 hypothetical protein [Paenibacillus lactis]GIO93441.1 hypothetical protein J31TS3_46680 [Paenibacillus lactis]HAF98213.1 hypothetical protein [Paenibacillus lactis]